MKRNTWLVVLMLLVSGVWSAASAATIIQLPDPTAITTGKNGDFLAYSAEINEFFFGIPQPKAANGLIHNEMVVYTHNPAGPMLNNNDPQLCGAVNTCIDSPFPTPTGAGDDAFNMAAGNEPAPAFTGDKTGAWDVTLAALQGALNVGGTQFFPVFMLDQNQEGTGVSQDVYGWGLVTIYAADGTTILGQFEFCGPTLSGLDWASNPTCSTDKALTDPFVDTTDPGEFVQAIGEECLDANGGNVPCDGNEAFGPFDNNLGTNTFEFPIISLGLNTLLASCWGNAPPAACAGATMSVEFQLRNLNDGDETIAIFGAFFSNVRPVPVPPTLVLVGIAFVGLAGFAARARRQNKS